ncbi:MAG: adenosine kinase [Pseudomonadota bacterium]
MTDRPLDVIGVGNAIVDVLAHADDAFLETNDIPKGGMILVDEDMAAKIYDQMAPSVEISGGSAANSIACIASLGGRDGFVGKVAKDQFGDVFRHDLQSLGVAFDTAPLQEGPSTGRCLVNVTPDAQRSMTTYLGAAGYVAPDDITEEFINDGEITFFEGYLFEQPVAREAFIKACEIANRRGRKAALTLSDSGCVERQHGAFLDFIGQHVDILLTNELEAQALFGTTVEDAIIEKAKELAPLTAVTQSENGSLLIPRDGEPVKVAAVPPAQLVDTTGAGDAYAAGLLLGLARQMPLETCGRLGSISASEVISHFGARPEVSLQKLAADAGIEVSS